MSKTDTFDILRKVVGEAKAFPNWTFFLKYNGETDTLTFIIQIRGHNNYDSNQPFTVNHYHPVPHTTFNEKSWRRWLFEQCLRTMNHEIGEALQFDGVRPFVPMHGPGEDPYTVHEWRTEEEALTTQDGTLRDRPV